MKIDSKQMIDKTDTRRGQKHAYLQNGEMVQEFRK